MRLNEPTDVLVATSAPAANHILAIAGEVYWAGERIADAERLLEEAESLGPDSGLSPETRNLRCKRAKQAAAAANRDAQPLLDTYWALMQQITDDELYARLEALVWRDRSADRERRRALYETLKAEEA